MNRERYRYLIRAEVPFEEVEASLELALLAAESIHGESQVRLDAAHATDATARCVVLDASTPVGRDLARLFTGFLRRGFGEDSFRVERGAAEPVPAACA